MKRNFDKDMSSANVAVMEKLIADLKGFGIKRIRRTGHNTITAAGVYLSLMFDAHLVRFEVIASPWTVIYASNAEAFARLLHRFQLVK